MGLNVGGIYVKVVGGLGHDDVHGAVRDYWLSNGATQSKEDPLGFQPLGLEKTGKLGFVVTPAKRGASGDWFGVYDSERYRADPELAAHLARRFGTEVWHYEITDAADAAQAKQYGGATKVVRGEDDVQKLVEKLPYPFLYYDKIAGEIAAKERGRFRTLGFEGIPHRPRKAYSGPSAAQLQSNDKVTRAQMLAARRDAAGLLKLRNDHGVYYDVIRPAVEDADLEDERDARFVCALGKAVVREDGHSREVAEAALRQGDEALFEKAMAVKTMEDFEAAVVEQRAVELEQAGKSALAFRLLEAVTRSPAASTTSWNNAAYCLHHQLKAQKRGEKRAGISEQRLESLLAGAMSKARVNSAIFHNLACALVELGRLDEALSAVEAAAQSSYPELARLKTDADLEPIRRHPRFQAAFRAERKPVSLADLSVERGSKGKKHRLVAPAFGLHLYFKSSRAAPAIADVIASLAGEFPAMFGYYRPSGVYGLEPVKAGKVNRDLSMLRKRPSDVLLQYDRACGEACDQRVFVELSDDFAGELSIHLPLSLAEDPDALFERCLGYARHLPFETGNAGFTLTPYEIGDTSPATDAHEELSRLLPEYLGLTVSQIQLGEMVDTSFVVPSWLTFLGPKALKKAGAKLNAAVAPATLVTLPNNRAVIRAGSKPFVTPANAPTDLGAFPRVVRALEKVRPPGDADPDSYPGLESRRMQAILAAAG